MASMDSLLRQLTRVPGVRSLWRRYPVGSIATRVHFGIGARPHYGYGVFQAAELAKRLGLPGISVVELGVAAGAGLIALERVAAEVQQHVGVQVSVFGFDGGTGMPAPADHRDLPYVWGEGFYRMDEAELRARLKQATLIIGNVLSTVPAFLTTLKHPLGFVAFDLDYYSSTRQAFALFDGLHQTRLPRVYCYFDDIFWPEHACHNEYIGELCAIRDFNSERGAMKLAPLHLLRHMKPHPAPWHDQIYVLHDFSHPLYATNITPADDKFRQRALLSGTRVVDRSKS
jgi:hypothetical protein